MKQSLVHLILMVLAMIAYSVGYMHGLIKATRMARRAARNVVPALLLVSTLSDSLPRRIQGVIAWAYGPSTHLYYVSAGMQVRLRRGLSVEALISPENKQAGHRVPLHGVPQVGFRFVF